MARNQLHHLKVGNFVVQKRLLRIYTFWRTPVALLVSESGVTSYLSPTCGCVSDL